MISVSLVAMMLAEYEQPHLAPPILVLCARGPDEWSVNAKGNPVWMRQGVLRCSRPYSSGEATWLGVQLWDGLPRGKGVWRMMTQHRDGMNVIWKIWDEYRDGEDD